MREVIIFPAFERLMPTAQLWMGIRNELPERWLFSGRIKRMGTLIETRHCQVQMSYMHRVWHHIWRHFHATEAHYLKSIKEGYQWAWMFTIHCLWIWILSWGLGQWTNALSHVVNVKASAATAIKWWDDFGTLESIYMNFCTQIGI